jgi:hypothetical protein
MGRKSTRKTPGTMAIPTAAITSSDAEESLSFPDSTFTPYATDKVKNPVRFPSQNECGEFETM